MNDVKKSVISEQAATTGPTAGPIEAQLRRKIEAAVAPCLKLNIENESHRHASGRGAKGRVVETHFKALVVSAVFAGLSRIERQRRVLDAVADELSVGGVHALTLRCLTAEEDAAGLAEGFISPNCRS